MPLIIEYVYVYIYIMSTIFFFGNCQLGAIKSKLNLKECQIYHEVCHLTEIDKKNFTNIIHKSDIIITQNISDNYRGKDYLNLSYILKNKKNKIVIIVPTCYFEFYYPDLKYIRNSNNKVLHEPVDYHYQYMIDNYKNNGDIENYIANYVNNLNLISEEKLLKNANNSINELKNRTTDLKNKVIDIKNIFVICIADFTQNEYKNKLLFYCFNHPTKYVIEFICEEIVNILKIENTINYGSDVLNNHKSILYKCIQPLVNFDIHKQEIKTKEYNDIFSITNLYYNTYDHLINFK